MRLTLKLVAILAMVLYPLLILWVLYYQREYLSAACLAGIVVLVVVALLCRNRSKRKMLITLTALLVLGAVRISDNPQYFKLYPLLISGLLLFQFAWSLRYPPSMIEQFARLAQRNIALSPQICAYCRRVTWVWVGFFCLNIALSTLTALCDSWGLWALYNGGISYVLIGLLMGGEWLLRRHMQAKTANK